MVKAALALAVLTMSLQTSRIDTLVAAVRPMLPYPDAAADGELPADNSAASKWFVVWPAGPDHPRIIVKANPLHPDTQKAGAAAMSEINAAVAAAERRAQEAYERAMEELRRTGKAPELEVVTLDDEGIAGERIDAELEVVIELGEAASFTVASSQAPVVTEGHGGPSWVVTIPPNTYRPASGRDRREHFRPAEARLYFGTVERPTVTRDGDQPLFRITVGAGPDAFAVIIRGNEEQVQRLAAGAEWSRLVEPAPAALRPTGRGGNPAIAATPSQGEDRCSESTTGVSQAPPNSPSARCSPSPSWRWRSSDRYRTELVRSGVAR